MNKITHYIDKEGNVVIDATIDNNTFGIVLKPRILDGIAHIKRQNIDTRGLDNPEDIKNLIISTITTQRGKYNEVPLIVE